ncbi:MAG: hypothetical protein WAW36_10145 [Methylovulum miyakonense]|uniref:hypothetical protein n=1 Tax=Methylovulum miyakonense TaxID=645578 RepID=UPI003BB4B1EE
MTLAGHSSECDCSKPNNKMGFVAIFVVIGRLVTYFQGLKIGRVPFGLLSNLFANLPDSIGFHGPAGLSDKKKHPIRENRMPKALLMENDIKRMPIKS